MKFNYGIELRMTSRMMLMMRNSKWKQKSFDISCHVWKEPGTFLWKKQTGLVKVITLNPRLPVSDFLCGSGGWELNVLQHLLCIRVSLQPIRGRRSNDKEVCFGPRSRGLPAAGEGRADRQRKTGSLPKNPNPNELQSPSESNDEQTNRTLQSTHTNGVIVV